MVTLQAFARAVLLRGDVASTLEQLDEHEEAITELQAAAKAFVVRAQFEEKKRFFNENMQKVVKIQSFVRAKLQGEAYKSLTTGKNPLLAPSRTLSTFSTIVTLISTKRSSSRGFGRPSSGRSGMHCRGRR